MPEQHNSFCSGPAYLIPAQFLQGPRKWCWGISASVKLQCKYSYCLSVCLCCVCRTLRRLWVQRWMSCVSLKGKILWSKPLMLSWTPLNQWRTHRLVLSTRNLPVPFIPSWSGIQMLPWGVAAVLPLKWWLLLSPLSLLGLLELSLDHLPWDPSGQLFNIDQVAVAAQEWAVLQWRPQRRFSLTVPQINLAPCSSYHPKGILAGKNGWSFLAFIIWDRSWACTNDVIKRKRKSNCGKNGIGNCRWG